MPLSPVNMRSQDLHVHDVLFFLISTYLTLTDEESFSQTDQLKNSSDSPEDGQMMQGTSGGEVALGFQNKSFKRAAFRIKATLKNIE